MSRYVGILFILVFIVTTCTDKQNPIGSDGINYVHNNSDSYIRISVPKWYGNHKAAVSITYDGAWEGPDENISKLNAVVDQISQKGLKIDFECVTAKYDNEWGSQYLDIMKSLDSNVVHFFGHGHEHIQYDLVDYDSAFSAMNKCFKLMTKWGLNPKAYAYPGSAYSERSTRDACRNAGFIGARGADLNLDRLCIDPVSFTDEDSYFKIPAIAIAHDYDAYYQNHDEVKAVVNTAYDRASWIVFMYHNIDKPGGWGWYEWTEFVKDLEQLKELDFWGVNLDDAICYIKERNNLNISFEIIESDELSMTYKMVFGDGLDNSIYNTPLTIMIEVTSADKIMSITFDEDSRIGIYSLDGNVVILKIFPDESENIITITTNGYDNR